SVQRVFAVRFAHSMASVAGLPGSGGLQLCFSLRLQLLRRQTQVFCFSFDAKEKRIPPPSNFCLCMLSIRVQYYLVASTPINKGKITH
ncbi:MAG: hypothetical protein IJU12_07865, partial [Clostridia bacterium]|nr:hypothetical protein [Clostridia bacterium]